MRFFKPKTDLEYSSILCPQRIEKSDGHGRLSVFRKHNGDIARWHENGVALPSTMELLKENFIEVKSEEEAIAGFSR